MKMKEGKRLNTEELRKAAKCVYLATDAKVADDLSAKLNGAADEIDQLREWLENSHKELNRL